MVNEATYEKGCLGRSNRRMTKEGIEVGRRVAAVR